MKARILQAILGKYSSMNKRAPAFSEYLVEEMMEENAFRRYTDVKIILTMDPNKEDKPHHLCVLETVADSILSMVDSADADLRSCTHLGFICEQ